MTQFNLLTLDEILDALPNGDTAVKVRKAYEFALQAHNGRCRESGELYIDHDLAVAQIMLQLDVNDPATIMACLLHDTVNKGGGQNFDVYREEFGGEVANLILGVNKLYAYAEETQLHKEKDKEKKKSANGRRPKKSRQKQALENVRRAILSITEDDIRIILIRMADCLQDLRKAANLPREKQWEIAREAMDIYAPLANRLGIWQLKWEIEDLAFRYLEPDKYKEIASQLAVRRAERNRYLEEAKEKLRRKLREIELKATVTGRPKHIYSIYRKMERKQVGIEDIYDVLALRIIIEPHDAAAYARLSDREKEREDRLVCFQALSAIWSLWNPIPEEYDDYIAAPKPNGYQSLHTAVSDPETGQTLEVQIRTLRMHEEAEKGMAAHWAYKEEGAQVAASVQRRIQGLRDVLAVLQDSDSELTDADFLETEIQAERLIVFTPKGDVVELPVGATPVDFAYHIHTEVGHRCRGARVNGKMVSLDYKLRSGDRVDILTSNRGGPSRDWMNPGLGYTGSARTRGKIRQWFRNQEREQNIQQGREVVERELKRLGLTDTFSVSDIARSLKFDDEDTFLAKVGFGDIQSSQISGALALMEGKLHEDDELRPLIQRRPKRTRGLTVQGVSGLHTKMAGCCQPIPPEKIVGYITRGHGITIHRQNCPQLKSIAERERLIEVSWGEETESYPIPIAIKAYRRPHLIEDIVNTLRARRIEVSRTKTVTSGSVTTIFLEASVTDMDQLNWLLQKLEKLPNVFEVRRQRWS